jgi:hypothetical protein
MPINSGEGTTLGEQAVGQSFETSRGGLWGYNNNNGGCGGLLLIFAILVIGFILMMIFS